MKCPNCGTDALEGDYDIWCNKCKEHWYKE